MKHRFVVDHGIGRYCFRCGLLDHVVNSVECSARNFPDVSEGILEAAENWVSLPHEESRNYLAVKAYIAGVRHEGIE